VQGALQGVLLIFFSLPAVQILAWRRGLSTYSFGSSYACLRRVELPCGTAARQATGIGGVL
jgi:hypothetical protein